MFWDEEVETLARAALEALQLERLQALLERLAADVPYYREQLKSSAPVRSLDDLATLPFTTKQTLRDHSVRLQGGACDRSAR